jgi:hypothetical protein
MLAKIKMAMTAEMTGWAAIADREPPEVFGVSDGWVMSTLSSGERLSP